MAQLGATGFGDKSLKRRHGVLRAMQAKMPFAESPGKDRSPFGKMVLPPVDQKHPPVYPTLLLKTTRAKQAVVRSKPRQRQ